MFHANLGRCRMRPGHPAGLVPPRVFLDVSSAQLPSVVLEQLFIDLVPLERVIAFLDNLPCMGLQEELFLMMPNIETLHLSSPEFYEGFLLPDPYGPHANADLFPSLRLLRLNGVPPLNDDSWDYLTTFLAHRASDNRTISLEVIGRFPHTCQEVPNGIKDLVKEITCTPGPEAGEDE